MGKGDKKSTKGKRTIGSYGNSRNRKSIKARLKRVASVKVGAKPAVEYMLNHTNIAWWWHRSIPDRCIAIG
jgi:ribosomal small subunit protein bTHX